MRGLITLGILLVLQPTEAGEQSQDDFKVRVYSVADLVAEPSDGATTLVRFHAHQSPELLAAGALQQGNLPSEDRAIKHNLAELTEVITATVAPDQWASTGGSGRITPFRKTMCLIIRQTESGHAEITELLRQLRHLNSVRVAIEIECLEELSETDTVTQVSSATSSDETDGAVTRANGTDDSTSEAVDRSGKLDEVIGDWIRLHGQSMDSGGRSEFEKAVSTASIIGSIYNSAVANGRSFMTPIGEGMAVLSADRQHVDFHLNIPMEGAPKSMVLRLPVNESTIVRMSFSEDEGGYLVVTPRLHVPDEEEEVIPKRLQR